MTAPARTDKKLVLSHTQCDLVAQCPAKWKLLKRDRVRAVPSGSLILGDAVHVAMEHYQRSVFGLPYDPTRTINVNELRTVMYEAFAKRHAKEDPDGRYLPGHITDDLIRRGEHVLDVFAREVAPHMVPLAGPEGLPLVEVPFRFSLQGAKLDDPIVEVVGKIDAICQRPTAKRDGWLTVMLDHKIIGKPKLAGWQDSAPQASLYTAALRYDLALVEVPKVDRITFVTYPQMIYKPGNAGAALDPALVYLDARQTARTERDAGDAARRVLTTADRLRNWTARGVFPARTGPLCSYCEVRAYCEEGKKHVRDRGITPAVPELVRD